MCRRQIEAVSVTVLPRGTLQSDRVLIEEKENAGIRFYEPASIFAIRHNSPGFGLESHRRQIF